MLALFANDAEVTMAPGTFRGKAAIRKFFEWEMRMAPVATSNDTGLGMVLVGRSVVWECQISAMVQGVSHTTDAVRILRSVRDFARKEWPLRGSPADVGRLGGTAVSGQHNMAIWRSRPHVAER
jgi:hypothetical protein